MRYLGIMIHYRRLTIAKWKLIEERLQKCLSSWKGKLLSLGGRLILINSVLSNMVLHMISFFLLPKGVLHKLDDYRSRFFWQGDNKKKNTNWLNGVSCVLLKTRAGLVFMTLRPKIQPYWGSGCSSYLLRSGLGKLFLKGITLDKKHYLRFFGNRVIRIFGLDSWQRGSLSLVWVLFH
jgi:hypothetical protein